MRLRPLPSLALALAAGILGEGLAAPPTAWVAAPLAAALTLVGLVWPRGRSVLLLVACALVGVCSSAGVRAQVARGAIWPGDVWPRSPVRVEGTIDGAVERSGDAARAPLAIDTVIAPDHAAAPARARVLARWTVLPGAPQPRPGDRVRGAGRLERPRGYLVAGAFDRARWLAAHGLDARLSLAPPGPILAATPPAHGALRSAAMLRDRLTAALPIAPADDLAATDARALLASLVLGDRGGLRASIDDAFRRLGVTHVLSVSGLHLAAVVVAVYALLRALLLALGLGARVAVERVAALAAAPVAITYALVTGAATATLRALIVALVVLGARALGRVLDGASALALAAIVVLAAAPWSIFEASFQLSFVAALALLLSTHAVPAAPPEATRAARVARGFFRLVVASAAAFVATAPLCALHFGQLAPAGLLMNLVVVPVAELVIVPVGLAGTALAALSPLAVVAAPLLAIALVCARGLVALTLALAPHAPVLLVPPPSPLELVAIYAALGALALLRPWRRAALVAAAAALVLGTSIAWQTLAAARRQSCEVHFLDVGQGDAAVVFAPGGETWLIDAGGRLFSRDLPGDPRDAALAARAIDPGAQAVVRFLAAHRVRRLDLVVISHAHPDHMGGLAAVAEAVDIRELWHTGDEGGDPRLAPLLATIAARGTRVRVPSVDEAHRAGAASVRVLAPRGGGNAAVSPHHDGENDDSLVVRVDAHGRGVLLLGDLEAAGEAELVADAPSGALAADVVKVAHHGSRTSSTAALVAQTRASLAVISAGVDNRFGFPAPEVVARWTAAGARVLTTAAVGSIRVHLGPGPLVVETFVADPTQP